MMDTPTKITLLYRNTKESSTEIKTKYDVNIHEVDTPQNIVHEHPIDIHLKTFLKNMVYIY